MRRLGTRKIRISAVTVLVALAMVGCASEQAGTAQPKDDTASSSVSTTTTAPPSSSRPRQIKLDGLDPCRVLNTDQMRQLGLVESSRNDSDIVKSGEVPVCDYTNNSSPRVTYGIGLVTTSGVGYWRGSGNVTVSQIQVGGYPAVQLVLTGTSTLDCSVAVDVADGQQLYVDFSPVGQKLSQEQMCENAKKAAEFAMVTLPTLK